MARFGTAETEVKPVWELTDHFLVSTELKLEKNWEKIVSTYTVETLKKEAHRKQIDAIFEDPNWPLVPFIEVAKAHNLTK